MRGKNLTEVDESVLEAAIQRLGITGITPAGK